MTNGYQVYHMLEQEQEDLKVACCWAHSRCRFDESVKAMSKATRDQSLEYLALKQIQAIYREENKLSDMEPDERLKHRPPCSQTVGRCLFCVDKTKHKQSTSKSKNA